LLRGNSRLTGKIGFMYFALNPFLLISSKWGVRPRSRYSALVMLSNHSNRIVFHNKYLNPSIETSSTVRRKSWVPLDCSCSPGTGYRARPSWPARRRGGPSTAPSRRVMSPTPIKARFRFFRSGCSGSSISGMTAGSPERRPWRSFVVSSSAKEDDAPRLIGLLD
jgi:hypothetical protein